MVHGNFSWLLFRVYCKTQITDVESSISLNIDEFEAISRVNDRMQSSSISLMVTVTAATVNG